MPIDDSNKLITIGADGTFTLPNANAVAFSLVPVLGKFPVVVVLDDDEQGALVVDSPRYQGNGPQFTKLAIREAQPHTTFKVRLLTDAAAGEAPRTLTSASGHLVSVPAGAVPLFDMDTNTEEGLKGWRDLVVAMKDPGNLSAQWRVQVQPQSPLSFTKMLFPFPAGPADIYNQDIEPGPTWNVSAAREVVFGVEMWGEIQDNGSSGRLLIPLETLTPQMCLAETEGGADFELLAMGSVGDFGNQAVPSISFLGRHGVVNTGAVVAEEATFTKRVTKKAHHARFEFMVALGATMTPDYFAYKRKYLRAYAYMVL